MKRMMLAALAISASALWLTGAGHEKGGGQGVSRAAKVYRLRRVAVPKPAQPTRVVRDHARVSYPKQYASGARIAKPAAAAPPAHHAAVSHNANLVRNIQRQQRAEAIPNHYYWHNDAGLRYSHYYDGRIHWYGFYHGPTFYWSRYYGDRWWWFDAGVGRWDFWWDGFWWWPGPGGAAYVYVDNNYYPYDSAGVTVEREQSLTPPSSIPAPGQGRATNSPDDRRMVQISGSDAQAFLYDKTASPPVFLQFLGQGVSMVRFSGGAAGAPLQVLVEFKDDTFALFDENGVSLRAAVKSMDAQAGPPPAASESIPPPPTAAPGQ